jgi:hypothetical protein
MVQQIWRHGCVTDDKDERVRRRVPQVKKEVCGRTPQGCGYLRGNGKKVVKASECKLMAQEVMENKKRAL